MQALDGTAQWNEAVSISESYPGMSRIQSLDAAGSLSTCAERVPLAGDPVLMVLTVCDSQNGWCGRVIIPQIGQMDEVDQWFMLQDRQGVQLHSKDGQPSAIRLKVGHNRSDLIPRLNPPRVIGTSSSSPTISAQAQTIAPPVPAPVAMAAPLPDPTVDSNVGWGFELEIIEAKNLKLGMSLSDLWVCASIVSSPQGTAPASPNPGTSVPQSRPIDHFTQEEVLRLPRSFSHLFCSCET